MRVIIVGGVAGGAATATRLRRLNEKIEIVVLERETFVSFANCGLPYFVGGEIQDQKQLILQTPEGFKSRFNIDVRVQNEVIFIDLKAKKIKVRKLINNSEYEEMYDYLVLSPGSEPIRPPLPGLESSRVFTIRTVPDSVKIKEFIKTKHPKRGIVVGAGFVGCEMAESLFRSGIEVTIVERLNQVLAHLDIDTVCDVHRYLSTKGVKLLLGTSVKSLHETEDAIEVEVGNSGLKITTDIVLLCVGERPDTSLAKLSGLTLTECGAIKVSTTMQTSDPFVFALGDAVEVLNSMTGKSTRVPLAGPATKEARVVAGNINALSLGGGGGGVVLENYKGAQRTSILRIIDLAVGSTGLNEREVKEQGINYDKVIVFTSSHAGYYPGATSMSLKVIFELPSARLLGAQVVGFEGVDKRIDVLSTLISTGANGSSLSLLDLAYSPPYGSAKDPVNVVGCVIDNLMSGKVKQHHWSDVVRIGKGGSSNNNNNIVFLDVRSPGEFQRGHIEGAISIPLDTIRSRINELDHNKIYYVNCYVGLRSYLACRILSQNGFDCSNLSGGYRVYEGVLSDPGYVLEEGK